jgi:hypothetical protein
MHQDHVPFPKAKPAFEKAASQIDIENMGIEDLAVLQRDFRRNSHRPAIGYPSFIGHNCLPQPYHSTEGIEK